MRTIVILVACVSLTAMGLAGGEETNWDATHAAGMDADQRKNYSEAVEFFKQSWLLAHTPMQRAVSANDLGQTYRNLKRPKDAREWLQLAYDIWRADPLAGHYLAVTAPSLSDLYRDEGDYARAEALLREALAAANSDPNSVNMIRNGLGDLLREQGRFAEAERLFDETLRREGISWEQRANALTGLADIERQMGDWNESARKWNEVLELARARKDENAEAIASRGLGSMWLSAGNLARAEPLFGRALFLLGNNPGTPPDQVASALSDIARLYRAENKLALAEDAWSRALALDRTALGEVHPQVAWMMEMLAELYGARGERELARDYANRAVDQMQSLFGEKSLPTAVALANRATVEQHASDPDSAAGDYRRALSITREHPGSEPLEKVMIERYAGLLKSMHRDREARELSVMARSFQ